VTFGAGVTLLELLTKEVYIADFRLPLWIFVDVHSVLGCYMMWLWVLLPMFYSHEDGGSM
jgi:hypothetical protein